MRSKDRTLLTKLGFADPDHKNALHDNICAYVCDRAQVIADMLHPPEKKVIEEQGGLTVNRFTVDQRGFTVEEQDRGVATAKSRQIAMGNNVSNVQSEYHLTKGQGQYRTTIGFLDIRFDVTVKYSIKATVDIDFTIDKLIHCNESLRMYFDFGKHKLAGFSDPKTWSTARDEADKYLLEKLPPRPQWTEERSVVKAWEEISNALRNEKRLVTCEFSGGGYLKTKYDDNTSHRNGGGFAVGVEVKANPVPIGDVIRQIALYKDYMPGAWILVTAYELSKMDVDELDRADIKHLLAGDKFHAWLEAKKKEVAPEAMEL